MQKKARILLLTMFKAVCVLSVTIVIAVAVIYYFGSVIKRTHAQETEHYQRQYFIVTLCDVEVDGYANLHVVFCAQSLERLCKDAGDEIGEAREFIGLILPPGKIAYFRCDLEKRQGR